VQVLTELSLFSTPLTDLIIKLNNNNNSKESDTSKRGTYNPVEGSRGELRATYTFPKKKVIHTVQFFSRTSKINNINNKNDVSV